MAVLNALHASTFRFNENLHAQLCNYYSAFTSFYEQLRAMYHLWTLLCLDFVNECTRLVCI